MTSQTPLKVNIVCMDHYMNQPMKNLDPLTSIFRGASIERVPTLRIYGSTHEGVKACVHVHGVFPYFYIPCGGHLENLEASAYQIASALDKAINITLNQGTSTHQHVYNISIEELIPFYGYHSSKQKFFKILLYNPLLVKKAAALLQSSNILGMEFQPFECHIPYKQQFMIDYNLFGMNFLHCANSHVRGEKQKESVCALEVDVIAVDIINREEVASGNVACNPGIRYIRDEVARRDADSVQSLYLTQNRMNVEPTVTDWNYREKLRLVLNSRGQASQASGGSSSCSMLDMSVLDDSQLEEHAQLLLKLWRDHCEGEEPEPLEECILSQQPCEGDVEDVGLNMSLLECVSNLEDFDISDGK